MFSKAINLLAYQLDLLSFIRTLISRVWASLMAQMVKESACKAGDTGLIPELGRSPGEGNGNPLQYFYLENSMDRGAWRATDHGVTISWILPYNNNNLYPLIIKAVYCHTADLTYMQSTSWAMLGWRKHKLESRLLGKILITSDMQITSPLSRKWRRTKEPLDESERGEWSYLKTTFRKLRSWHPVTSLHRWGNNGNGDRLYFWGAPKSRQMVIVAMK